MANSPRFFESDVNLIDLAIPHPVQLVEIERWASLLGLSEAQATVLESFHRDYWERYNAFGETRLRALWSRSAEVAKCREMKSGMECVGPLNDLMKSRDDVIADLAGIESALFARVASILAEPQAALMQRVLDDRSRSRVRFQTHDHPAATVDLTLVLEVFGQYVQPSSPELLDSVRTYEQTFTPLWSKFSKEWNSAHFENSMLLAEIDVCADPLLRQHMMQRWASRWKRVALTEQRLVDVNRVHSQIIQDLLPPEQAGEFTKVFLRLAYPNVYPVIQDVEPGIAALVDQSALSPQQSVRIEDIRTAYAASRDRICMHMTRLVDDFIFAASASKKTDRTARTAYREKMDELFREQTRLAEKSIAELDANLDADAKAVLASWRADWTELLLNHKPSSAGLFYRP